MQHNVYIKSGSVEVSDVSGTFLYKDGRDHIFQPADGRLPIPVHHLDVKVRIGHNGKWHRPRVKDAVCTGVSIRVDGTFVSPNLTGRFVDCTFKPIDRDPLDLAAIEHTVEVSMGKGTPWMRDDHLWRVLDDMRVVNSA